MANEEQSMEVIAKRIWGIVRVAYLMLRKGVSSKRKLLLDLNMFMKRRKLAGKAAIATLLSAHSFRRTTSDHDITPATSSPDLDDDALVRTALQIFASPAVVRQLRVTDSPFPMRDAVDSRPVDEAAEAFIKRFYNDLNRQRLSVLAADNM